MPLPYVHIRGIPENRGLSFRGLPRHARCRRPRNTNMAYPHGKYRERCENRNWRLRRKEGNMTEPIAMTIRHMKIEDYSLVYGLWTMTGFTDGYRRLRGCNKTKRPDTCFVAGTMTEESWRDSWATTEDGRASTTRRSTPTHAVALMLVGRVVETLRASVCRKSLSECCINDAGNDFLGTSRLCSP